jgi:hypothetical protein
MSEKEIRFGRFTVTTDDPLMSFEELINVVDDFLMREIRRDKSGILMKMYNFFDSGKRPLDPREFFEFLGSLNIVEELEYMDAGNALPDFWYSTL